MTNSAIATFHRYEGADQADQGIRMSMSLLDAKAQTLALSELLSSLQEFHKERESYPWASRFAMGLPLPSWQRPLVWSQAQKVRFIESIWNGVDIGSYLVNDVWEFAEIDGKRSYRKNSNVLLDGQQRLTAIEEYVLNVFAVPDARGTPRYWRDLPQIERRRFGNYHFARATLKSWDEAHLRWAYDMRAFGGTPHTESQRASAANPLVELGLQEKISLRVPAPTPEDVRAARKRAGLNQAEAAELVGVAEKEPRKTWASYELPRDSANARTISRATWELFLMLTGQHPHLRVS